MNTFDVIKIIEGQKRKKLLKKNTLATIHHTLMSKYGWIPLKDLEEMPIPMALNLINEMVQEAEMYERELNKVKSKLK